MENAYNKCQIGCNVLRCATWKCGVYNAGKNLAKMGNRMVQIAITREFLGRWGEKIKSVAPQQVELVVMDAPGEEGWRGAEVLLKSEAATDATPAFFISNMPRLRWVHSIYAGTNDLPWEQITARDLVVTNSAGVYAPMMAEYVLATVVMLYRNLPAHWQAQREHRWGDSLAQAGSNDELYGKHMGILGYGATGRYLAQAARALGMRVWALRRTPVIDALEPVERMLVLSELDELLRACDIVVLTASLNTSTRGLLGADEFARMKPNAVLVNVARGAILDEDALAQALQAGKVRGAILDVTTTEPLPPDSPLWDAPNLFLTPHISGEMPIGRERSIELFCKNLGLYLEGNTDSFANRVRVASHV